MTSRRKPPSTRVGLGKVVPGFGHLDAVAAEVGQVEILEQQAAVGMRVGAHPSRALRGKSREVGDRGARSRRRALRAGSCASTSRAGQVRGVRPHLGQRHLVRAPRSLDRAGRRRPSARSSPWACAARSSATRAVRPARRRGRHRWIAAISSTTSSRVAAIARCMAVGSSPDDPVDAVAVALEQARQLVVADPGEHRRVGDLVAVQVQDRQHGAVGRRVEELVGVPAGGERSGLGLAVADDAADEEVGVVECGAVGVDERVAELASLVDRPGVSGATWDGMPPGNENWRNSARSPSRLGRCAGRPRCRCPRGRRSRRPPDRRGRDR